MNRLRSTLAFLITLSCVGMPSLSLADRQAEAAARLFGVIEAERSSDDFGPAQTPIGAQPTPNRSTVPQLSGARAQVTVCDFESISLRGVQSILAELDLYRGEIDGIYGRQTENAIRQARRMLGLPESGSCLTDEDVLQLISLQNVSPLEQQNYNSPDRDSREEMALAAEVFLSDLETFILEGGQGFDIRFPLRYSEVRDLPGSAWTVVSEETFRDFQDYALANQSFAEFREQQTRQREENYRIELDEVRGRIFNQLAVIQTWISANLLDERAALAAQTVALAEGVLERGTLEEAIDAQQQVEQVLVSISFNTDEQLGAGVPQSFDVSSVFIFGNFSGRAEWIYKNLFGEVEFEGGNANICIQSDLDEWHQFSVFDYLRTSFAITSVVVVSGNCVQTADIVLISGYTLASEPEIFSGEASFYQELAELDREYVFENRRRFEVTASIIESDILSGARTGFGIISHDENNDAICLIVESGGEDHISALAEFNIELGIYFDSELSFAISTDPLEAFRRVQARECGSVYGSEETLHALLMAFRNNGFTYNVLPVWVSQNLINDIAVARTEREAMELRLEQERIAAQELDAVALREALERSSILQERLRQQNSVRMTAIVSALNPILSEAVRFGFDYSRLDLDFEEQYQRMLEANDMGFPISIFDQIIAETNRLSFEQWELNDISYNGTDYGTVLFNRRSLDGVLVEVQLELSNRILGEFRTYCWLVRAVIDEDFDIWRAVELDACGGDSTSWMLRNSFESGWNVQVER